MAYLPISRKTFYDYGLHKSDKLKRENVDKLDPIREGASRIFRSI